MNEYVKKGIARSNGLTEVMERRQTEKMIEYENVKLETMIAEEKKKLQDASPTKIDSSQATGFAAMLFAGRKPEEIKQILSTLTQDEIDRLAYMASSMNANNFANFRGSLQAPNTPMKDIVEALKVGIELAKKPESNGIDMKGIAEIFKAGVEAARVQQPANPQGDLQYKLVENTLAELKATREEMSRQDRARTEKEIAELKARPSGFDELVNNEEKATKVRKLFGGTDSGTINEFTLRKAEMDQTERLETRKLDWEEKKWEKEKDKEGSTLETVKEILAGPAGDILKTLGGAGADRIRGNKNNSSTASQAASAQIVKVNCPSCKGIFAANSQLSMIQCPLCGVQLQNGNQPPATPQEQQASAPAQEQSKPPEPQVSSESTQASSEVETNVKKPIDETVEAESPVEPITTKQ